MDLSKPIVRRERLVAAAGAPATVAADSRAGSFRPTGEMQQLIARLEGDEALAGEMAVIFVRECPALLARIRDAVQRNAAVDLHEAAHLLKGAVANFSAGAATERAAEVEQLARTGGVAAAAECIEELDVEIAAVLWSLKSYIAEHQLCG
jgi:HPt (histidine-containing phosphotransfer) domain-containing protein